jgi:ABC-type transport system substrate-binding protein
MALLIASIIPSIPVMAEDEVNMEGPWADELFFKIYLNPETEYLALKTGEINLMDWELPAEKVADALADPNIMTDSSPDLGYYQIDLNHQRWPTSDVHFRRACAHLVDKARIETDVLQGFGYKLESVVPVLMGDWSNPDVRTYEYSAAKAAEELELGGFTDTDGDGVRNDPITGENMADVIFYIRIDDPERKQAGQWLADELKALGVPVYDPVVERAVCSQEVMLSTAGEWNVYTGGWGIGRDPDHLTDLYHSKEYDPEVLTGWRGYNYGGFSNATFDSWADILKTASTFEEVKEAAYKCQEIMAEQVTVIPLYGHIGVKAYSKDWTDLVNQVGTGINSWWSCYNMHPVDMDSGGRIEYGIKSDIETLNPLTAAWTYTWEVLDKIYPSPYSFNPYNLAEDWPGLAESWEIEDWINPEGTPGLKVTFNFVENAYWHDGVPFTGEDLKFTYEYIQDYGIPRYLPYVQFIEELVLVDDYTLEVYQNTTSYFAFHYLNGVPVLPKHIWENVGADWQDYDPVAEGELVGLGPWKFVKYVPGEYVHLVANEKYWNFPDRFYQGLSVSDIQQSAEITSLKKQLEETVLAGEVAAKTIGELGAQLTSLEESTRQLLEASADDIDSLETQISTLTTAIQTETVDLETKVSRLEAGLSSASNIGYASIGIAVIMGVIAIFMSRRSV